MRLSVVTGVLACTLVLSTNVLSSQASASTTLEVLQKKNDESTVVTMLSVLSVVEIKDIKEQKEVTPEAVKHVVKENETLTKIAKQYDIEWKRIFDKNAELEDPNVINPDDVLIIPDAEEELETRELPAPPPPPTPETPTTTHQSTSRVQATNTPPKQVTRGDSNGNLYTAGYCTWYVKNRRPDLPNNLGNAATWVTRAAAQGMTTSSTPKAGAVGQRGNHVVYVERVNSDGSVTISEMNHKGLYVQTTRTLPADYFVYIL